jgi:hypothetical protein
MEVLPYKTFNMDENTSQISEYFHTLTINDTLRFSMYSNTAVRKNILIFDISTGEVVDSIRLHKEGPHAINNNVKAYYIHNRDSIYLYNYWQHIFMLVNRKGEIISRINLSEKFLSDDDYKVTPSSPFPSMEMPIKKVNTTFILQGMTRKVTDIKKVPTVTAICNLADTTIRFVNTYPDIYGDTKNLFKHWGVFSYLMVSYDLNNKGEMVLSYPAYDHIVVYDINSNTTRNYFAGYSKKDVINQMNDNPTSELVQYMECTHYCNIHFDPYMNLYYRFVYHPYYEYDINDSETQVKNMSIIILDSEFNKVGEYDLKEIPSLSRGSFVSKEGLHIQTLSDNDDFMKFITLKPVKL